MTDRDCSGARSTKAVDGSPLGAGSLYQLSVAAVTDAGRISHFFLAFVTTVPGAAIFSRSSVQVLRTSAVTSEQFSI
jgi:hypothetical protein